MKTLICYYSRHHGNTRKVLEAIAQEGEVDLVDVTIRQSVSWDEYDCIGFASGIYGFEFQKSRHRVCTPVSAQRETGIFVYTYGGAKGTGAKAVEDVARAKGCPVLGEFSCKGYDTFGPFKLMGVNFQRASGCTGSGKCPQLLSDSRGSAEQRCAKLRERRNRQ